jgi:DNA modification methylase
MRQIEEILVWKMKKNTYYPQRIGNQVLTYTSRGNTLYVNHETLTSQEERSVVGRLQTHLIKMKRKIDGFTTRPEEMIELFLRAYTKEGDTVLDPTCYKGLSGLVARRMNRKWIGIDKYFLPSLLM